MLTIHQEEKLDDLIQLIKKKEKRIVLTGSAGVGKTTLANELITEFRDKIIKYGTIWVTAPTHKALAVLKSKIKAKEYIEFATVHSALKLQRKITKEGLETFVKSKYNPRYPPLQGCKLMILDESSMVNEGTEKEPGILRILDEPEFRNILIVFLGDEKQLNPVNEEFSPVFQRGFPTVTLSEIIRQAADNPIIELSNNLAKVSSKIEKVSNKTKLVKLVDNLVGGYGFEDIDENGNNYTITEKEYPAGIVYTNDRDKIIDRLAEINGTDELKYLAWTNDEVDKMNTEVRNKIYMLPSDYIEWKKGNPMELPLKFPKKIEINESIVLSAPYGEYNNNEEIKIKKLEEANFTFKVPNENTEYSHVDNELCIKETPMVDGSGKPILDSNNEVVYPYDKLTLKVYIANDNLLILHEHSEAAFEKATKIVNGLCRGNMIAWILFYWFKEQVLDFKYNHATSIHKSQGSTYEKAILNVANINFNKNVAEKKRLFYTAITRASELVILYNIK